MRTILGLAGVAALSALTTALVSPPASSGAASTTTTVEVQPVPTASVLHVTKYVQLKPGETAPPAAVVKAAPAPTPRIVVITTTRQSGKP